MRALDDFAGAVLHGQDRLGGLRLDALHQVGNLFGGAAGPLGQPPHFVGHDGEAATVFAGHRGRDRRVERQQVRLVGDLLDELHDLPDLLRAFAEALDLLRRVLHFATDAVHSFHGLAYGLVDRVVAFIAPFVGPGKGSDFCFSRRDCGRLYNAVAQLERTDTPHAPPRNLERSFVSFRTRSGEKEFVQAARQNFHQPPAQLRANGSRPGRTDISQITRLILNRLDHRLVFMPQRHAHQLRGKIEILLSIHVRHLLAAFIPFTKPPTPHIRRLQRHAFLIIFKSWACRK